MVTIIQKTKYHYHPVECYICGDVISESYMKPSYIGPEPHDQCDGCDDLYGPYVYEDAR